jgi:peptide deformylase
MTDSGVDKTEGTEIINQLLEVMNAKPELLALAAPQIGIKKRIFCLRFSDKIKVFIDPIIKQKRGLNVVLETCASMPGQEIVIGRPAEISAIYYNEDFKYEDNKLIGVAAGLFDQQIQLLDGTLPTGLGMVTKIDEVGHITEEDLPDVFNYYKEVFLPSRLAEIQHVINEDEELQKAYKNLQFTEAVINGRITVVESEAELENREKANKIAKESIRDMNLTNKKQQEANYKNYVAKVSRGKR